MQAGLRNQSGFFDETYSPVSPDKLVTPWRDSEDGEEPLAQIGFFDLGEMHFEVYEGRGGKTGDNEPSWCWKMANFRCSRI